MRKLAGQHDAISLTCGSLAGLRGLPMESGEAEKPGGTSGGGGANIGEAVWVGVELGWGGGP